jgi:hypothetical protein
MLAESGPGEVRVEQVLPDSAAEQSGLTAGDRLLSINGVPLETARGTAAGSLRQARWVLASANEMRLLIELGEDATGTTQYTHWSLPIPGNADDTLYETGPDDLYLHGLTLRDDAEGGVRIDAVRHGTPAAARGIPPGSHLTAIQGRPVHALIDVQRLLNEFVEQPWIQVRTAENDLPRWPIHPSGTRSAPVHPTQLYSAINAALLCLLLLAYEPFRRRDGELIALELTIYPVTRYLLEAIRTDESAVFGTGLSISQNVSIGILAAAGLLWWYVLTRPPGTKRFDGYATPGKPDR